jgi:hypothetical protein
MSSRLIGGNAANGSWSCLAAASLLVLGLPWGGNLARGDIIVTVLEPARTIIPPGTLDINLNNKGSAEFRLSLDIQGNLTVEPIGDGVAIVSMFEAGDFFARPLMRCERITSASTFTAGTLPMTDNGTGPWSGLENRYLGLRFLIAGQPHLAWACLDVRGFNSSPLLKSYAYNSLPETEGEGHWISPGLTGLPTITCPNSLTVECDQPTDPAHTGVAQASDGCFGAAAVTYTNAVAEGACPQAFVITRTWTAVDDFGQANSCDQIITVHDTVAPVLTLPPNAVVECGLPTDPNHLGTATATDNCDPNPDVSSVDSTAGACPTVITRTWTATDDCGNADSQDQTITVQDTTQPSITACADNHTLSAGGTCTAPMPDLAPEVVAEDDCDPDLTIGQTPAVGVVLGLGVTPATITVSDDCGNSTPCGATITVVDDTAPTITCPQAVVVPADPGTCQATNVQLGTPITADNCGVQTVGHNAPASFPLGKSTVTWTAVDAAGNAGTCQQTVTVLDVERPTLLCPQGVTVECGEPTDPPHTGAATATDLCDPSVTVVYHDSVAGPMPMTITRTWTGTDDAGNARSCQQIIKVEDTIPPQIAECPESVTLTAGSGGDVALPDLSSQVTAVDLCDDSLVVTQDPPVGTAVAVGEINATVTVTDDAGLTDSQVIRVMVLAGPSPPQPTPGGAGLDPAQLMLWRCLLQSFCGVPLCGVGWVFCLPPTCLGLLTMKLLTARRRRGR